MAVHTRVVSSNTQEAETQGSIVWDNLGYKQKQVGSKVVRRRGGEREKERETSAVQTLSQ